MSGALLAAGLFDNGVAGQVGALAGTAAGTALLLLYSLRLAGISPAASAKPAVPVTEGVSFVVLAILGTAAVCLYGAYKHNDGVLTAPTTAQRVFDEQLDPGESVSLTPPAIEKLVLFTFRFYLNAPLITIFETPPDDEYVISIEPAPDRVTPPTVAGGAEAVVTVAVELSDGQIVVAYDPGAVSLSP